MRSFLFFRVDGAYCLVKNRPQSVEQQLNENLSLKLSMKNPLLQLMKMQANNNIYNIQVLRPVMFTLPCTAQLYSEAKMKLHTLCYLTSVPQKHVACSYRCQVYIYCGRTILKISIIVLLLVRKCRFPFFFYFANNVIMIMFVVTHVRT